MDVDLGGGLLVLEWDDDVAGATYMLGDDDLLTLVLPFEVPLQFLGVRLEAYAASDGLAATGYERWTADDVFGVLHLLLLFKLHHRFHNFKLSCAGAGGPRIRQSQFRSDNNRSSPERNGRPAQDPLGPLGPTRTHPGPNRTHSS